MSLFLHETASIATFRPLFAKNWLSGYVPPKSMVSCSVSILRIWGKQAE